jgi:hypothetical protein
MIAAAAPQWDAGYIEHVFVLNFDWATHCLVVPPLGEPFYLGAGSRHRCEFLSADVRRGQVVAHSHPVDEGASDADLDTAMRLAARGIGSCIVNRDMRRAVFLRWPAPDAEAFRWRRTLRVGPLVAFCAWEK